MRIVGLLSAALLVLGAVAPGPTAADDEAQKFWNGAWFECEFASRTAPPDDDCAMLDDDGFRFGENVASHIKVVGSKETDACKKQLAGQCFRADEPSISASVNPTGAKETLSTWFLRKAEFSLDAMSIPFLGCNQVYHVTVLGDFIEARPDDDRCPLVGKKRFYLRRYAGEIEYIE